MVKNNFAGKTGPSDVTLLVKLIAINVYAAL